MLQKGLGHFAAPFLLLLLVACYKSSHPTITCYRQFSACTYFLVENHLSDPSAPRWVRHSYLSKGLRLIPYTCGSSACQWATSPQAATTPYGRAVQACVAHVAPPPPNSTLYLPFCLEKKIREKVSSRFAIRRRRHILFFIWRVDLESVSGSGERKSSPSSSSTFLHRQFHDDLHRS